MKTLLIGLCIVIGTAAIVKIRNPQRQFFQSWENKYPEVRAGIIHDYEIKQAQQVCVEHGSELHYVVPEMTIYSEFRKNAPNGESGSYPCSERLIASCQNDQRYAIEGEVKYCFISVSQMEEALKLKQHNPY